MYFAGQSRNTWSMIDTETRVAIKKSLVKRDGLLCSKKNGHGCGNHFRMEKLTIDHVVPIARGGPVSDEGNMQLLCRKCHEKKTANEKYNPNRTR